MFACYKALIITPRVAAAHRLARPAFIASIHTSRRLQSDRGNRAGDPLFRRPAPPPLPAAEQRELEELVKAAAAGPSSSASSSSRAGQDEPDMHPDARRKPRKDFEGDVNPVTGEVGGPKTEPVRHNDWSYGGRATDF